ncbi:MAG: hypothetical protein FJZ00_11385 [Candidatus Sericytochromatia bacterium]|uniref:Uncharacterized protein n=1 Tax=Candidatus Tanganyikabacteria bacterium TaxID=2961651 RepID=A0A938BNU4_9BACT|nr:hypothetical protein [Candidatus Tanganyikabacteria bacterium]
MAPKAALATAAAPVASTVPLPDRYRSNGATVPMNEAAKQAELVAQVKARQAASGGPQGTAAPARDGRDGHVEYLPPGVSRPVYTGGAPALRPDHMDKAVVQNNLILRGLYAVQDKAPWLLKSYMAVTKVAGPIGAWLNVGFNIHSAKRILSDPRAPGLFKAGVIGSTGLAGVSAVAATRVGLHAFNVWPMAAEGAKVAGKVAGVAGLGAATILSAMDTYTTFKDPGSTSAEKGFSLLATGTSAGLTAAVLMGVTGPVGIGLGIGAIAFTLAKSWLGKNKVANQIFGAVGGAISSGVSAIASAGSTIANGVTKIFSGW